MRYRHCNITKWQNLYSKVGILSVLKRYKSILFLIIHFLGEVNESLPLLQPNTENLPTNSDDLVEVKVEDPGRSETILEN